MENPSDSDVIREVLLGNTDLFGVLFERYSRKVFGYFWHFSHRKEDCEDFLQDTFYRAYVNLKDCREHEKFSSWLFSIARNVALSGTKRLSLYYTREVSAAPGSTIEELAVSRDLGMEMIRQENAESVRKAISEMPPTYKEVIIFFYYNEFSVREISHLLSIPANTVKTRLYRARRCLSEMLRGTEAKNTLNVPVAKALYH